MTYNADEVMSPDFRLHSSEVNGISYRDVYIQTFEFDKENGVWSSSSDSEWWHLARISSNVVATFPIHTNPHAKRYLTPRHGRIHTVTYELGANHVLPDSVEWALSLINVSLGSTIWNDFSFGLGLVKELDPLVAGLRRVPNIDTLSVTNNGSVKIDGSSVIIPEWYLNDLKKLFDKGTRRSRERLRIAKSWHIQNELLPELDPVRFPRLVPNTEDRRLIEHKIVHEKPSASAAREERRKSLKEVRENAKQIVKESPYELVELHSEIERVTLTAMIEKYEQMMQQKLGEDRWQNFFEQNTFILSLAFARPVTLLHTQFHAQGSQLDGSGAQVGDFLLKESGPSFLAIIEIKKPSSPLILSTAYRNTQVFAPNAELSGAITQVLFQKTLLHANWLYHKNNLKGALPDTIKCVVISGVTPAGLESQRSFEIFRNACRDVEIVTFDELLIKLKLMLQYLTPKSQEDAEDLIF